MFPKSLLGAALIVMSSAGMALAVASALADPVKPSQVASAGDLVAVVEDVVKSLEPTVASPQSFDKNKEEVEHKGYVIALIANAVSEAQGEAQWKGNAAAVRDKGIELAKAKSQANAAKAVQGIKDSMSAAKPSGGSSGAKKYLDIAPLEQVMKEVNERNRAVTKNMRGTGFSRNKEAIARDAEMFALLGSIAREDKQAAEKAKKPQAEYEKYADELVAGSQQLAQAAKKADANGAKEAFNSVKKACSQCHAVFRPDIE